MADQMRHDLPQRVRGLLEQERWIGTGFYAHVRVTRVNDGTVRLRVRPHAQPGRFFTVWIVVLLAWGGSRLPVIPLNWLAIAGAGSELARPREQLAHGAACRVRSPRCMLRALLWAIAGGVRPDGAPASLMWIAEQRRRDPAPAAVRSNSARPCGLTLMERCRPVAAAAGLAARDAWRRRFGRAAATGWSERGSGGSSDLTGGAA